MKFIAALLLSLLATTLAVIDQKNTLRNSPGKSGERSRQFKRSCSAATEYDDSFLGPFIVHLEKPHTHEVFENSVRKLQDDQWPFADSTGVSVCVYLWVYMFACVCVSVCVPVIFENDA